MYEVFCEEQTCIGKSETIEKAFEIAEKQEDGVYTIKKDGKPFNILIVRHLHILIRKK
ncbi:MAG: hypothetical protein J6S67_26210 [Methanobrevibacter sp.]|nr:hypothetical protein [Methanobrevibacter sp.]